MPQKTIQLSFFIALTISLLVLLFFVLKPFWGVIFISCVLSAAFYPLYQKFLFWFKNKESLASVLTVLVIVVAIVIPVIFISANVFSEAVGLYNSIAFGGGAQKIVVYLDSTSSQLGQALFHDPSAVINVQDYFRGALGWIIGHFDSVFTVVFRGLLGFVLMLVSIFYLLRGGSRIKETIVKWSPLPDNHDEEIIAAISSTVDAVFRGRFLVALAQGLFLGLGFFVFGVGNPILWGFVGAMASLIPVFGTSLLILPASVFLFVNGDISAGIGMLIWGALAVGPLDDTFSFFILRKKIKINPLIILFSILGGVQFFGPLGFIAGPVLVSALIALMKIYPSIMSYKNQPIS